MIKIIKAGTKQVCDCEFCGCKFSFDSEDTYGNQHDGTFIKCPQCQKEISLSAYRPYEEYASGVNRP